MNTPTPECHSLQENPDQYAKRSLNELDQSTCNSQEEELIAPESGKSLICCHCSMLITDTSLATTIDGTFVHTQCNPSGLLFRYHCYLNAPGCIISGQSVSEFSWHSGYRWQYAHCSRCSRHLGWFFSGSEPSFFGLLINQLTPVDIKDR